MHLRIGHLYPQTMSTYGDGGNITALTRRCQWRNIEVTVVPIEIGQEIPADIHLYFFGGGQDASQERVAADLQGTKAARLLKDAAAGVPILAICGGYQLLGISYQPAGKETLPGIGLFPVTTTASTERLIGNVIITTNPELKLPERTTLVGFENHSGKTSFTDPKAQPLGKVRHGKGNNGHDGHEGCILNNSIGCYLHGSLLPKNPHLADWLLGRAISRIDASFVLTPLDNGIEWAAHDAIVGRYA